jgi:hypothetical protein
VSVLPEKVTSSSTGERSRIRVGDDGWDVDTRMVLGKIASAELSVKRLFIEFLEYWL